MYNTDHCTFNVETRRTSTAYQMNDPSRKIALHLCISGFTQKNSSMHGIHILSEDLLMECNGDSFSKRVWLREWNADWKAIAERIFHLSQKHELRLNVYAYSWGGGWGAVRLAKYLEERGVDIQDMVLCDPVYRHPRLLLRPLSLIKPSWWFAPKIKFTSNVKIISSLHQTADRFIQGHDIVVNEEHTRTNDPYKLNRAHAYMDDSHEFRSIVWQKAHKLNQFLKGTTK